MNGEDFYMLEPGAIGTINYIARTQKPTEEQLNNMAGEMSSQMFSSYLANYALTQGQGNTMDPATAFSKFRQQAKQDAEALVGNPTEQSMYIQIGQQESLDQMTKVEQSENFVRWVDARLVALIRAVPVVS